MGASGCQEVTPSLALTGTFLVLELCWELWAWFLFWFVLFLFVCFLLWENAAALFDLSDGQGQVLNPPPSSPADLKKPPLCHHQPPKS